MQEKRYKNATLYYNKITAQFLLKVQNLLLLTFYSKEEIHELRVDNTFTELYEKQDTICFPV